MNVLRKMEMAGDCQSVRLSRHGCYVNGLPKEMSWRYRLRTWMKEAALRARLSVKGLVRGLRGSGVLGVGRLYATVIRAHGGVEHLGLLSTKVITDAGVAFLVGDWDNNGADISTMNFHGWGTGTAAENVTDVALGAEITTGLNPDSTRATGTRSQPTANQYRSVATGTFDAPAAVTEHGIFSQAATGGGTMWDRSVFAVINIASGDSIQTTYTCTLSSGG